MSYATILVHVQSDEESQPRLRCARAVADMFDAALFGVAAQVNPPPMPVSLGGGSARAQAMWVEDGLDEVRARLEEARTVFEAATAGRTAETLWESHIEFPVHALARVSGSADLIVASSGRRHDPHRDAPAADIAIASGRPVLVATGGGKPLSGAKVVVAWKDTREARRALADALPFLKRAEAVMVLEVREPNAPHWPEERTAAIALGLRRHGVAATAKTVEHDPADGHEILRQAEAFGADLIVAGAYGHSRLQERVFGGVTQQLLSQDDVHLLISH